MDSRCEWGVGATTRSSGIDFWLGACVWGYRVYLAANILTGGRFFCPVHHILGHVLKTWWTQFNKRSENKVNWVSFLVPLVIYHAIVVNSNLSWWTQIYRGELKSKRSELKFQVLGFLVHHDRSKRGAIVAQNVVNWTKKLASAF